MNVQTDELIVDSSVLSNRESVLKDREYPLLLHLSIPVSERDPLAVLERMPKQKEIFFWEKPDFDISIAGGGIAFEPDFNVSSIDDLKKQVLNISTLEHSLATTLFLGGRSFASENPTDPIWEGFDPQRIVVPKWTFVKNGNLSILGRTVCIERPEDFDSLYSALIDSVERMIGELSKFDQSFESQAPITITHQSERPYKEWEHGIENAKDLIRQGELDKIVLARYADIEADRAISPTKFANRLRQQYPGCYTFIFQFKEGSAFVGSTPERLVSFHNRYILTEALAGSISRGKSAREDDQLEYELAHSSKDINEHRFVVESIVDQLQDATTHIQFDDEPGIKKIANVQHLHTPITAWLKNESDVLSIVDMLHPTPAVGGLPIDKALPVIPKLEKMNRGWYAGPVGWFTLEESGEFVVAIRSGIISNKSARFFAGCGIVKDSDPVKEWDETKLKLIPMLTAIQDA